jgi:hypothetical protein
MVAIKSISVIFDLLLAVFTYKIIRRLRPASRWEPVIGTGLVLALPTVVMNSGAWGQCDSIYVSLCVGSLYFLISDRPWPASALFGLAFAFKLQAIFFLPVLAAVLIINRQRIRSLLAAPAMFAAALLPAMLAGRGLLSQLAVYPAQISNGSGAPGGGTGPPDGGGSRFGPGLGPGRAFGPGGGGPGGMPGGGRRGFSLTDGYSFNFYLAEVLTVIAIFVDRRFVLAAAGIQAASISTYVAYLENARNVPLGLAAVVAL